MTKNHELLPVTDNTEEPPTENGTPEVEKKLQSLKAHRLLFEMLDVTEYKSKVRKPPEVKLLALNVHALLPVIDDIL